MTAIFGPQRGDERWLPDRSKACLLIDAYPPDDLTKGVSGRNNPRAFKIICYTYALTYLTGQPIGRSRMGADGNPENRALWHNWWLQNGWKFFVPTTKPRATWVPSYDFSMNVQSS